MKAVMLGLLTETSLHVGAESTGGVVDLPVAREAIHGYPMIPGSGLKGALKDRAQQLGMSQSVLREVFGEPDGAGGIAVTDARLLLLPVRSLNAHFKWLICPYLWERWRRDLTLSGHAIPAEELSVAPGEALAVKEERLFLEEFSFTAKAVPEKIAAITVAISPLLLHEAVQKRLAAQMVVVSDQDFAYFARYALPVNARNVLDKEKKTSKNLWYEEVVPADTLFYSLLLSRPGQEMALNQVKILFETRPYLQVGGNETIGQGWCAVTWQESEEAV